MILQLSILISHLISLIDGFQKYAFPVLKLDHNILWSAQMLLQLDGVQLERMILIQITYNKLLSKWWTTQPAPVLI